MHSHTFFVRQCGELSVTWIETNIDQRLGQVFIFTVGPLGQTHTLDQFRRTVQDFLIESVTDARFATRTKVAAILILNCAFDI